jgi:hypothetical protein
VDKILQEVAERVCTGKWYLESPEGVDASELQRYKNVRDELCVTPDNDLILRGTRIVVPGTLQTRVLALAHEGHMGLVKTKQLLREKVWFPHIDNKAESLVKNCLACQATTSSKSRQETPLMSDLPTGIWQEISVDFWGPTPDGTYAVVMVDDYSRYPEVELVPSVSAETVIPVLDKVFSGFGIPRVCKTDNGPPFQGGRFKEYCDYMGCKHRRITPLWPQANGEAERFMQNIGKVASVAKLEGKNWKQEIYKFLRSYRNTPHPSTGKVPAELMFGRTVRTKLPSIADHGGIDAELDRETRMKDMLAKEKMAKYKCGDRVLAKQKKTNKFSAKYDPVACTVVAVKGPMAMAVRPGHIIS